MREEIKKAERIVIKVGTSTLTYENGLLNLAEIEELVRQIADLSNRGKDVILVSSGAVGAGLPLLGLTEKPKDIATKQAAASVGQGALLHIYEQLFRQYGIVVGQVLLTRDDSQIKKRYVNLRNTLHKLLDMKVVPIINENDVVSVDELKIGDNDTLSATVASIVEADLLIILSDINGLYTANPQVDAKAKLIPLIETISMDVLNLAGGAGSKRGTGGMITKLEAAKIAMNSGVDMIIANGKAHNIITQLIDGKELGTLFRAPTSGPHMKKRWLAFGRTLKGRIYVDDGCAKAIKTKGSSLLAVGIVKVEGHFLEGETVSVYSHGEEIGRGMVNYSSKEIDTIKGLHTETIAQLLHINTSYGEVIHRDNLVVLQ